MLCHSWRRGLQCRPRHAAVKPFHSSKNAQTDLRFAFVDHCCRTLRESLTTHILNHMEYVPCREEDVMPVSYLFPIP